MHFMLKQTRRYLNISKIVFFIFCGNNCVVPLYMNICFYMLTLTKFNMWKYMSYCAERLMFLMLMLMCHIFRIPANTNNNVQHTFYNILHFRHKISHSDLFQKCFLLHFLKSYLHPNSNKYIGEKRCHLCQTQTVKSLSPHFIPL